VPGAVYALSAAALFGASTPAAKLLLRDLSPLMLSALLYLGAAIALSAYRFFLAFESREAQIIRRDLPPICGIIFFGGMLGPIRVSIVLDVKALRVLGAARESAYFATAPFVGAFLSIVVFGQHPKPSELAGATLMIIGVRVAILAGDRDRCCGAPLFETGQIAAGRGQAVELLEAIRNSGATAVLTSGAECLESLRSHYPQYLQATDAVSAMHPLEVLADRISTRGLKLVARKDSPPSAAVAMLDSCHLSKKGHGGLAETG
jgi:uncharacterized membrane protein